MITETRTENRAAWAVRITGPDRITAVKRAAEITAGTDELMLFYSSGPRGDGHEIQMEFLKGDVK